MESKLLTVSATSEEFKKIVEAALAEQGELFVLKRPSGMGGKKHWYLIHAWAELDNVIIKGKQKDAYSVFPGALLLLGGKADSDLEKQALALLEKYGEIVHVVADSTGPEFRNGWGSDEIDDTKEFFIKFAGQQVFIGRYPDFELEIVGAYAPDVDGVMRPGAY